MSVNCRCVQYVFSIVLCRSVFGEIANRFGGFSSRKYFPDADNKSLIEATSQGSIILR